jgi:hypothetical protein
MLLWLWSAMVVTAVPAAFMYNRPISLASVIAFSFFTIISITQSKH